MAANMNSGTDFSYNQEKIDAITKSVNECFTSVIDKNVYWTDDEKSRIRDRLKSAFAVTLREKLASQGTYIKAKALTSSKAHEKTKEKRRYLEEILLPEMDTELVTTTKKRRHCPYQIARQQALQCKYDHSYLMKLKCEPESGASTEVLNPAEGVTVPTRSIVSESAKSATSASKDLKPAIKESECLIQVSELQETQVETITDQVIAEPTETTVAAAQIP